MKKRNFLSCLLIIAVVLATISPTVLFAAEDIAQDEQVYDETYTEETEEYVEETPEAYDWTIETNELKKWPQGPRVEAEGATVMDLDTGAFLYSKNAEAKLYPASITKIMTMLVALEHISDSDLDTKVKASESALAPIDSDSSQIWLSVGEKITVRSALYAIMLASANDAANVIAEYVGGSMDNFVKMMNDKAKELGCVNTHFVNPHGLHNKKQKTAGWSITIKCSMKTVSLLTKTARAARRDLRTKRGTRSLLMQRKTVRRWCVLSFASMVPGKPFMNLRNF